ncbi:hypothetical protein OG215_37775 (plasmid) [Streptomyces globisporus]|uniref:hypothetical protein n=1 Tax=Streptomyces globisporus TaxID=1908 RepID=UPI002F91B086|nr:hypothetical protein OG215_37775 [Streptomyces globisporus]
MESVIVVTAALALGYALGRMRPWWRLDGWAEDQLRFSGRWVQGGTVRLMAVALARWLTAPRESWRAFGRPPAEPRVLTPQRDPNWAGCRANVTRDEEEEARSA